MDWIDLLLDTDKKQAVVKAVMNLRVTYTMRDTWLAQQLLDSQKGLPYMELLI
jgi:hypothetical protein